MKLYPYQENYIRDLSKNVIMACDTGTGKGQMSLAHYKKYSNGLPIVIVAPAAKAKTGDWERELEMAGLDHIDCQIISYDKFARRYAQFMLGDFVLIADEVHFIKSPSTKRAKATLKVAAVAKQFIGLSATPLPGGYKDMGSYAILWRLARNKTEFVNRFVITDRSRGFPLILGYREKEVLKNFWNAIAKPLERSMESTSIPVEIEMTQSRLSQYAKIKKSRITPEGEMLDSAPKLFSYLRQFTATDRSDALRSILDGTSEHVILFYNYNTERDEILKVLADYDVTVYEQSGHASNLPPRDTWDTMRPSVTVAQYQSASTAIELQYASITIYYSPTYSFSDFHQSMGRTKRIGQKKTPVFYMFRVAGTIDKEVWSALKEKKDFSVTVWYNNSVASI